MVSIFWPNQIFVHFVNHVYTSQKREKSLLSFNYDMKSLEKLQLLSGIDMNGPVSLIE